MVTLAQRIEELRTARGLSRPALAAALGFPRTAIEKFETGRQTPTQDQQNKLASYFGVSLFYLRGETNDTTQMSDWMDGAFLDEPAPVPAPRRAAVKPAEAASSGGEGGTMKHRLQRYVTVNSKRHPRNLILGCLFVSSSFHSVPSSALCFAKSQEVDPSRSQRNLIVSLMLGSLGQIDLIVIKGGQPFHPRPAAGRDDSI